MMAAVTKMMAMAGVMAGALIATAAHAGTLSSTPGNVVPTNPSVLIDFDGTNGNTTYSSGFSLSGTAVLTTGSANGYSRPMGDTTQYLMVNGGKTAELRTKDNSYDGFGLYWGSIDSFNTLEVLGAAGNVLKTITGLDVISPTADVPGTYYNDPSLNRYVTYTLDSLTGERIAGLRFSSGDTAFELDNVTFFGGKPTSVPEPATLTLFGAGIGGLIAASRRRRKKAA
ncbi:hypothetical protein AV944_08295 [Sphingomonas sp. LK11]|jgi:hypothetical protein|nr:hypothetical protein AV944_08295 [Sphingomonas sp. LK11]